MENSNQIEEYYTNSHNDCISDENERQPYLLTVSSIDIGVIGYACPLLAIPTILANIVVISVFAKKRLRSPTSILLIALAIIDSVVCFTVLPSSFYFYAMGNYKNYVTYGWCNVAQFIYFIQRTFRTASNWQMVILGIERFIVVCYPFHARYICTFKKSVVASVSVLTISVFIHFCMIAIVEIKPLTMTINCTKLEPHGCTQQFSQWFLSIVYDLENAIILYYSITGLLSRFLPCLILIVTTGPVVYILRIRRQLIARNVNNGSTSFEQTQRVTFLVLVIVFVFLVVEIQDVIAFGIYIYEIVTDKEEIVLSREDDAVWETIGLLLSLVGYLCNFWIYILMSREFRKALTDFFIGWSYRRSTPILNTTKLSIISKRSYSKRSGDGGN